MVYGIDPAKMDELNWHEVALKGDNAYEFYEQLRGLETYLVDGWQVKASAKSGNPLYVRPSVLVLYREDHRFGNRNGNTVKLLHDGLVSSHPNIPLVKPRKQHSRFLPTVPDVSFDGMIFITRLAIDCRLERLSLQIFRHPLIVGFARSPVAGLSHVEIQPFGVVEHICGIPSTGRMKGHQVRTAVTTSALRRMTHRFVLGEGRSSMDSGFPAGPITLLCLPVEYIHCSPSCFLEQ